MIPTKFPSYLVRHPRKVAWLFHQHREAYDLLGTEYCSFTDSPEDQQVLEAIRSHGRRLRSASARAIFTISRNVADRLSRFNRLEGHALYPPAAPPRPLSQRRLRRLPAYAGRLDRLKRVSLMVDALVRVRSGARLKIAGAGPLEGSLRQQIDRAGVADRVELLGFVSVEDLLGLYARCRAALYAPVNEDYGYVTLESFLSRKPVVTTDDSGGVLEFVEDAANGLVAAPRSGRPGRRHRPAVGAAGGSPAGDGRRGATPRRRDLVGPGHRPADRVDPLRVAVWSPLPPIPSGIADHTAELLPALARHHEVVAVVEDPDAVDSAAVPGVPVVAARETPPADLDLYQVGNSPAHVFVYRAALARPGVVLLHEWVLHDLVWREAVERDDVARYLREMRRSHGATGSLVGRQVARGLGGTMLPALLAVNDHLLEESLGAVALTRETAARLTRRHPGLPTLTLPQHHAAPAGPVPTRPEARRVLGLPAEAEILTAPGFANGSKRLHSLVRAVGRLRDERPALHLVLAGGVDPRLPLTSWAGEARLGDRLIVTGRLPLPDLVGHLAAADVVSALRFPSRGEMSAVLIRAMGLGRPVLVTAGTPAAEEMPEGTVVPVGPDRWEVEELQALLGRLLGDAGLRAGLGDAARRHVLEHHDLVRTAAELAGFLAEVHRRRGALRRAIDADRTEEGTLTAYFVEEVRQAARDLGLVGLRLGLEPLLRPLDRPRNPAGGNR